MRLLRSWPAVIPEGRAYVVDNLERFVMGGPGDTPFCYRRLVDYDEDIILIEWDIAVGAEQLATFIGRAAAEPDRVRVAPYLLYRRDRQISHGQPFYVHRIRDGAVRRWAQPDDTHCQYFGFGLIYLPKDLIRRFVAQMQPRTKFGDSEFSRWHMRNVATHVPIDWECRAVHLHYALPVVV